jgi:predicted transglutaminase-like cysteine proteinase
MLSAPMSAAQIAQQKLQEQGAQPLKQGASKFDQTMANKAQQTQPTGQVDAAQKAQATTKVDAAQKAQATQATQSATKVEHARHVEQVNKSERASLRKVDRSDNAASRTQDVVAESRASGAQGSSGTGMMVKMMGDLEKGQGVMDKLIESGLSGRQFSSSELLSLQAGMFKYTQELELTGKVVEKATSGLKDTLKTQV